MKYIKKDKIVRWLNRKAKCDLKEGKLGPHRWSN